MTKHKHVTISSDRDTGTLNTSLITEDNEKKLAINVVNIAPQVTAAYNPEKSGPI
jgi:hypothetical protein